MGLNFYFLKNWTIDKLHRPNGAKNVRTWKKFEQAFFFFFLEKTDVVFTENRDVIFVVHMGLWRHNTSPRVTWTATLIGNCYDNTITLLALNIMRNWMLTPEAN